MLQQVFDDFERELGDWQHEGWEAIECASAIIRRHKAQESISAEMLLEAFSQSQKR